MKILIAALVVFGCLVKCTKVKPRSSKEIIQFENNGTLLKGELNIPGGADEYPLAVFIHGSGRATRKDYEEFMIPLLEEGIAIFRYDKRGVGESGGEYSDVGPYNSERVFTLLASDAAAAIKHFADDSRISRNKIIVIGGSQAGWIIPEINSISMVWLSICISGPAVTVGQEIFYSDLAEKGQYAQEHADQMLETFAGMDGYNPLEKIGQMKSPSLWILGGKDVSIPIKKTMHLLDSIRNARDIPLQVTLYPEADHGLFNSSTQQRERYVDAILNWIRMHR